MHCSVSHNLYIHMNSHSLYAKKYPPGKTSSVHKSFSVTNLHIIIWAKWHIRRMMHISKWNSHTVFSKYEKNHPWLKSVLICSVSFSFRVIREWCSNSVYRYGAAFKMVTVHKVWLRMQNMKHGSAKAIQTNEICLHITKL